MKKLLCLLFVGLIIGISSPSFAFRNNCDSIMADIMRNTREYQDLKQFEAESRPGTPTNNKMKAEIRQNREERRQLDNEYQRCMEWRKKRQ